MSLASAGALVGTLACLGPPACVNVPPAPPKVVTQVARPVQAAPSCDLSWSGRTSLLDGDTAVDVGVQVCATEDGKRTRALALRTVALSRAREHHRILRELRDNEQVAAFAVGGGHSFVVVQEQDTRPRCPPGPPTTPTVTVLRCSANECAPPKALVLSASTKVSFAAFDRKRGALAVFGDAGSCIEGDAPQSIHVCDLASWSCMAPAHAEGITPHGYWTGTGAVVAVHSGMCGATVRAYRATVGPGQPDSHHRDGILRVADNNGDDAAVSFDSTTEWMRFVTHKQRRSDCSASGEPATHPSLVACDPNGTCTTTDLREAQADEPIEAVVAVESKLALITDHATKLVVCDAAGRKCRTTALAPGGFDSPRVFHVGNTVVVLGADRIATCRIDPQPSCFVRLLSPQEG